MPGRGHRWGEPPPTSVAELADGAAAAIADTGDQPVYLFGHSLGALVAFEVARRLCGLPALRHLVASGCSAPSLLPSARVVEMSRLEGQAFAEAAGFFGGLPPEVVADPDLQQVLLPGVQADFRLVAGYQYRPAQPLPVGLTLVNGRDDPHIRQNALTPWEQEVTAPPAWHWNDGGHFYFENAPETIASVLRDVVRTGPPPVPPSGNEAPTGQHSEFVI
jgi:surfactin synthase thioesterase subunit